MSARQAVSRVLRSLFRGVSAEYRAYGDLFLDEYSQRVDWKSGVGEGLHALYGLARALRPTVIVETGSARGKSTCALALACKQNNFGKVFAIDPHAPNAWAEIGTSGDNLTFLKGRLKDYGLERWCEILRMTSGEAIKNWQR